jgi:TolB protein
VSGNQIWKMTPSGTGLNLLSTLSFSQHPRWFPSGTRIAFEAVPTLSPTSRELWIMNADGTNKQQITTSGGLKFLGDVSPDGRHIVFAWRLPATAEDIYIINIDGTGLQQLTANSALDFNPVWSPDGREIAFVSNRNGNTHIFIMAADGTNLRQVGFSNEEGFFGIDW